MEEKQGSRKRATVLTALLLVAASAIYPLSIGPALRLMTAGYLPPSALKVHRIPMLAVEPYLPEPISNAYTEYQWWCLGWFYDKSMIHCRE